MSDQLRQVARDQPCPASTTQQSGPSQRQLRVGELVRHALADVFARGEAGPELDGVLVSIAEVRMSPDLKHATALVAPLAASEPEALVATLNKQRPLSARKNLAGAPPDALRCRT